MVVELRSMDGMVPEKFEGMRVGPKAQLKGAVLAVGRGTVFVLSEMGRESENPAVMQPVICLSVLPES